MSFCHRFCSEFKRPMFDIEELRKEETVTLDINASFHIGRGIRSWVGAIKLLTFFISIASLVYGFAVHPYPFWYPVFLTHWGVVFCIMYLGGSFLLTTRSSSECNSVEATRLVKFTWLFYSVAAVMGCCIAVLYWAFVFKPSTHSINLNNCMTHGGCLLIVLLQGLLVDHVPLRIKHNFVGTFAIACVYASWLALQNLVVKYNPMEDADDDALYDAIKWRENTVPTIILTAGVLFVAIPLFTILLWTLSLPGRKYVNTLDGSHDQKESTSQDDSMVQEGLA